jgi:hypothetical protein
MRSLIKVGILTLLIACSSVAMAQTAKYKCMVQMNAYTGEEAYIVISLINPKGGYEKTLYMMGDDKKWYNGFVEWFKFFNKSKKLNAKTGASIGGGDRTIVNLDIDDKWVGKNYKVRFESSVEAQKYFATDVEIPLTQEALTGKTDGSGYIKYIRFSKVQP